MTREEWLQATTRQFEGVTIDQALNAAEKLFRLADGDDFTFAHSQNELLASRQWTLYFVIGYAFGTDLWSVKATPYGSGVQMTVQVITSDSAHGPFVSGSNYQMTGITTYTSGGLPVQGTAVYNVFWSRMEYLLGKRKDWTDCEAAYTKQTEGLVWGDLSPICNTININDDKPDELRAKSQARGS